jgi:hypothetical protein
MTLETGGRPATTRARGRLTPRSSIAVADIELARYTLVELAESRPIEEAGERVIARLRRFVVGDADTLN